MDSAPVEREQWRLRFIGGPYDNVEDNRTYLASANAPERYMIFYPSAEWLGFPAPAFPAMEKGDKPAPPVGSPVPRLEYRLVAAFEDPLRGLIAYYAFDGPSLKERDPAFHHFPLTRKVI